MKKTFAALLSLSSTITPLYAADNQRESIFEDVMVVTATHLSQDAMDIPANVSVVTRSDIQKMGAVTLEQALRSVPGLQFGVQGNAYPHIEVRGLRDTKDLAVLINGIPFRQLNGSADLTMIPVNIVERIEFVKGPSSSIWGRGSVAGTLNIITTPANTTKTSVAVQGRGGSFSTFGGDIRGLLPYNKGFVTLDGSITNTEGYQDNVGRKAQNGMTNWQHRFYDKLTLNGQFLLSNVDADRGSTIPVVNGQPMSGVDREDNYAIDRAHYEGTYSALTMSPLLEFTPEISIQDDFSLSRFERDASGGTTITSKTRNKSWWLSNSTENSLHNDLRLTYSQQIGSSENIFLIGSYVEFASQDIDSPSYLWSSMPKYGPPNWNIPQSNITNPPTGLATGKIRESSYDQKIYSFYLQDSISLGSLSLIAGVRYDHFNEELTTSSSSIVAEQNDSAWNPRAGITWNFLETKELETAFFVSYAEGFRTQLPKLSTYRGNTLPQLLDPEKTKSYETGLKFRTESLSAQLSYFLMKKKGPRSFRTSSDDFLFTDAKIRVDGIEAELNYTLNEFFSLWGTYAWHDARYDEFVDSSGNSFAGNRVRMSPKHIAGIGTNINISRVNWNTSLNYVGDRNLRDNTTGNLHNLDTYITVNTSILIPYKQWKLQLTINNIFDEYYIADDFSSNDAGYPGEPRNFMLSLRYDF